MSEAYLEPVIVRVVGDIKDLLAKIKEAQSLLEDFSKTVSTAHLSADYKLVTKAVTEADAELKGFAKQDFDALLGATSGPLQGALTAADTELAKWGSKVTKTQLGANSAVLQKDLLKINAELAKWGSKVTKTQLSADQKLLLAQLAKTQTELSALAKKVTALPVTANTKAALASATAAQQGIDRMKGDIKVGTDINTAGALAKIAILDTAIKGLNDALGGGGGGGAKSTASLLTALGLGGMFGLAHAGSAAGLAGFGPERLITTILGILGFTGAAAAGGSLLGLAALTTSGVGLGTDTAGIGQAVGDITQLYQATNNLNQMVAEYGPNSSEAAAAQKEYNNTLAGMPAVARGALKAATSAVESWTPVFDKYTGPAEKIAAEMIAQFVPVAEKLLPEIGSAATKNMRIIQKALQPFLTWLDSSKPGGGLTVLTEIENTFSQHLPNAMKALTGALQALFEVTAKLDPQTGKITNWLANFFTSITTPTPPPKPTWHPGESMKAYANAMKVWETEVANDQYGLSNKASSQIDKWVADWHVLVDFFKALFKAAAAISAASAGTGESIFTTLTSMLNNFTKWARSKTGFAELNTLMTAHKKQLDAILELLGSLIGAFGKLELTISPTIVNGATAVIKALDALFPSKLTIATGFTDFIKTLTNLATHPPNLSDVTKLFGSLVSFLTDIPSKIKGLTVGEMTASLGGIALLASRIPILKHSIQAILGIFTGKVTSLKDFWNALTGKGSGLSASATQLSASAKALTEAAAALKESAGTHVPSGPGGGGDATTTAEQDAEKGWFAAWLGKTTLGRVVLTVAQADITAAATRMAVSALSIAAPAAYFYGLVKLSEYVGSGPRPSLTGKANKASEAQLVDYLNMIAEGIWTGVAADKAGWQELTAGEKTLVNKAVALEGDINILLASSRALLAGKASPDSSAQRDKAEAALGLTGINLKDISTKLLEALIAGTFGDVVGGKGSAQAKSIGEQIIAGLTKGLQGKPETTAFKNLIKEINSIFGISSPSKVFIAMGMANMQGLAKGTTDSASLVMAAYASVVNKTLASLTADIPRFRATGSALTQSLFAGAGSLPAFHGAGAGGGNIEITSHITFQITGMPDMTHGSTFSRQLKSALDEHDRKLMQAIRAGRS